MVAYALVIVEKLYVPPMHSPIDIGAYIGGKVMFHEFVQCVSMDKDELVEIGKDLQGKKDGKYVVDSWHIESVPVIGEIDAITCEQCAHGQEVGIHTYCHEMREYVPRVGYCWKAVSK